MTDGDKLLMHIDGETFAVDADSVAAVIETERIFMLPLFQSASSCPMRGFIKGVITRFGDTIVVIDMRRLFGILSDLNYGHYKVIVLKKDALSLGMLVSQKISFLWKEDIAGLEFKPLMEDYIYGMLDPSGKKIRLVDWQKIFEETRKAISCR